MAKGKRKPREVPADETKAQKFHRVCALRMGKALTAIDRIGNCSSSSYEYTPADVAKIRSALGTHCAAVLAKFVPREPGQKKAAPSFSFEEQPSA